jgi:hypothetical protein
LLGAAYQTYVYSLGYSDNKQLQTGKIYEMSW